MAQKEKASSFQKMLGCQLSDQCALCCKLSCVDSNWISWRRSYRSAQQDDAGVEQELHTILRHAALRAWLVKPQLGLSLSALKRR